MKNRLLITVDVEARPTRAAADPIDRLIWGRFPEGEFGIGRMMSIADRHGAKLTMFLDYAEEHLYGDSLLDVGREIHRRGHDLQLHLHPEFMPDSFYAALGSARVDDFRRTSAPLAGAYFDFLCDRQAKVGAPPANAFRGYGYFYNGEILQAMKGHGLRLASNYNVSRDTQPMLFGPMPQFNWELGIVEVPISTVFDFQRSMRFVDYNFNGRLFSETDLDTCLDRHLDFLDRFYNERGTDAVAVLVLHSWSFLEQDDAGIYSKPVADAPTRFDLLLSALGESVEVIDSRQMVALVDAGALRLAGPFRFGTVRSPATRLVEPGGNALVALERERQEAPSVAATVAAVQATCRSRGTSAGDSVVAGQDVLSSWSGLPIALPDLLVTSCPVCGDPLATVEGTENCPHCSARARTRSLAPVLGGVVEPLLAAVDRQLPLLAFAMTPGEQQLLAPSFPSFRSVSLFGEYAANHETGVDARDLSRYANQSFSGVYSILLFDYFPEHEQALREVFRVLAPGGVLFTLIAGNRLLDGDVAPFVRGGIKGKPGSFDYLPSDFTLPSVRVGRRWFIQAMRAAGFTADLVPVKDTATGQILEWFIGQKPPAAGSTEKSPLTTTTSKTQFVSGPAVIARQLTSPVTRTYSTPVDPAFGFSRVALTLTIPAIPVIAGDVDFAEHAVDPATGAPTDSVVALRRGGVLISDDLGRSWEFRPTPETESLRPINTFTLADGHHLIQDIDPFTPVAQERPPRFEPQLLRFDRDWRLLDRLTLGRSPWHGARSIDRRGATVIYAEYPPNKERYQPDFAARRVELEPLCVNSNVFRSADGGVSWTSVLEVPWTDIRHFHTVAADPYQPGVWWLSSGDQPQECRVWRSADDGLTWIDVTGRDTDFVMQPRFESSRQSAFRYTDVVVTPDNLIWGSDDLLGNPARADDEAPFKARVGARIFVAPKTLPLRPDAVAHIGNPVRSIVDVGPCYLVATEAKRYPAHPRPQLVLLAKTPPYLCVEIGTIDRFATGETGFTYSKASRVAKDGRFFSYRGNSDVVRGGPRLLQWDIDFL